MSHISTNDIELAQRRAEVVKLYLEGHNQWDIAYKFNVNQSTISRDIRHVMNELIKTATNNLDEIRQVELSRLNRVEVEMWAAWERSQRDAETETEEFGSAAPMPKVTRKRQGQVGDPRYMTIILQCIEKRCKLLGLEQNIARLEVLTWQDRVIEYIKEGRIKPELLIEEIGMDAARPLLNRANVII